MASRQRSATSVLLVGLGWLLLVDLFLDWRAATTVSIGGALRMHGASSGWVGWGALTGVAVITLLVVESVQLGTAAPANEHLMMASALLAFVILGSSIAAFADHSVTMSMGGAVQLTADTARHWPAYVGVVLAAAIAVIAVARLIPVASLRPRLRHKPA